MTDFDEPKDPSWLLAFDWVQLNKLHRAYKDGGDDALEGACRDLMNNDLLQFARIACAYMPDHMPQRIKGALEDDGYTLQGLIERTGHEETTLGPRLPAEGQAWLNGLNPFCRRAVEHDLRAYGPDLFVKYWKSLRDTLQKLERDFGPSDNWK